MPYPIEKKLVVAISSSAVFNMVEADRIYREDGPEAYRKHQRERLREPFAKGVAFPFVKRFLQLNRLFHERPVEVVVLSRNDPDSGLRFFESCQHYDLDITRGAFVCGRDPYPYIGAFNASLFLSANERDVRSAIASKLPGGLVLPTTASDDEELSELRIAFDFDGVIASDEAEQVYQDSGLELFQSAELEKSDEPLSPGPLHNLASKLSYLQELEAARSRENPEFKPMIRIAVVTARNAPAHTRCVRTLESWGLTATETFFMGGIDKSRVLRAFKPHLFLDDQLSHLEGIADEIPCVHIPFGISNTPA
jgi:5'-nucleotidase